MNEWVRAPSQARSRDTLSRIFAVTEDLLAGGGFESASITEIVKRADTSTGSFYARFENKEALFHALHEQFLADALARIEDRFGSAELEDRRLESLIRRIVEATTQLYGDHAGLLKAVFYHTRINPTEEFVSRSRVVNEKLIGEIGRILLSRAEEIRHPRPEEAVRFSVTILVSTLREAVVFDPPGLLPTPTTHPALIRELTNAITCYLGGASA